MGPLEAVALVALTTFSAAGLIQVARAVVPILWLAEKPFSCTLCLSFWFSSLAALAWGYALLGQAIFAGPSMLVLLWIAAPAAIPGAMLLTRWVEGPR